MKKIICWFLLLSLALLPVLSGCKGGTKDDGTQTEPPVTEEPVKPITVFAEGQTAYSIVRAEKASQKIINSTLELRKAFKAACGVEFPLCDEYMYSISGGEVAIVIGETEDEVTKRLKSEMQYDDFQIHVENKNLYIIGGSEEATLNAVTYFIETYLAEETATLTFEGDMTRKYVHEYTLKDLTVAGTSIASYKIVYKSTLAYSKSLANQIQTMFLRHTGAKLDVIPDTNAESEYEILVGVTNRAQSTAAASEFGAPNAKYRLTVSGKKMLVVNQGVRTGEAAYTSLQEFMNTLTAENCDINSGNLKINGDISPTVDKKALARPEGTEIRLMHSNVLLAVYDNNNAYTDQQRAELLADTYLLYLPDVITFNEMLPGRNMTPMIQTLLADEYIFADATFLPLFMDEEEAASTTRITSTPIAYRKNSGLKEIKSAFSYLSDNVTYHGVAWTVFEMSNGNRFLAVSAHFSENKNEDAQWITTFAEDFIKTINVAREEFGDMPVVANGDWFFWQGAAPYSYVISSGFKDVSEVAVTKHSVGIGTFHTLGVGEQGRVEEDISFITPEWFTALAHKIIVDVYTVNGSDHYPIMVDLKFNKRATVDDILPFDDGTGNLNIKDEGTGGTGEWGTSTVPKA